MLKSKSFPKKSVLFCISFILSFFCTFYVFGPKKSAALYAVYIAVFILSKAAKEYRGSVLQLLWLCASILGISMASQRISAGGIDNFSVVAFAANSLIAAAFVFLFLFLFDNARLSVILSGAVLLLLSYVNRCVFFLKGNAFTPNDIFAARTAFDVLPNYQLPFDGETFISLLLIVCLTVCGFCLDEQKLFKKALFRRFSALCIDCLIIVCWLNVFMPRFGLFTWGNDGAMFNGYLNSFFMQLYTNRPQKPENYSAESIALLEDKYASSEAAAELDELPHIVVIMDESFADFKAYQNDISTNIPVLPYISSLTENTVKGHALVSTFGGGTANSEYEFFTGNTMAMLPLNATAYQLYLNTPAYSVVSQLRSLGYKTFSTHPAAGVNWSRDKVYPLLGFEASDFIDNYPRQDFVHNYVSDREVFSGILERLKSSADGEKQFIFGLTMQNHGGYSQDSMETNVSITDADYPDAEVYLSCINSTDSAVQYLLENLKDYDEDVLVVFFGDHLPGLSSEFFSDYLGESTDTALQQMSRYTVPFFIWANYDIEEAELELTSLNYLSVLMYKYAGIPLPPYQQFLSEAMNTIPAINAFGYYSAEDGSFKSLKDAQDKEAELINQYAILEYNSVFDKNRSNIFFP